MTFALTIVAGIVGYEVLRAFLVGAARRSMRAGASRFVRQNRVQLELARFVDRIWMRERIASDKIVELELLATARRTGRPVHELRDRVDRYVEEIAPDFSMASYYQFGAGISRRFVEFCFEMVVDQQAFDAQMAKLPANAVRVYVFNHRSNFDPVVIAFGLVQKVAVSYAVGEWALVWPLSSLFRSFGGYFVRRGEKDPLYHIVLERFIQLLAGQGAVTGFFPEGGLTRDGALRRPRSGLLEYIVKLRIEHPEKDIVFVPVGLNYDRVLEDRWLVADAAGHAPKRLIVRLLNLIALIAWLPVLISANLARYFTWAPPKFGYAALAFGEPLTLSSWPGGSDIHELPDDQRKEAVRLLARELLYKRVGHAIPVVPVAITCTALLEPGGGGFSDVVKRIKVVTERFRAASAPLAFGPQFAGIEERRKQKQQSQIPELDENIDDADEAELILMLSLAQLQRRRVVRWHPKDRRITVIETAVAQYYANSARHHLDPTWFDARDATSEEPKG